MPRASVQTSKRSAAFSFFCLGCCSPPPPPPTKQAPITPRAPVPFLCCSLSSTTPTTLNTTTSHHPLQNPHHRGPRLISPLEPNGYNSHRQQSKMDAPKRKNRTQQSEQTEDWELIGGSFMISMCEKERERVCVCVCVCVRVCVCLSICLSVCLSVHPSVHSPCQ